MKAAVRFYSRSGNTKAIAEAIAKGAGVEAVSVDSTESAVKEPVDVLFVGGALYAYGLDKHLSIYLKTLRHENVKKVVVFTTTWISKHSADLIKKAAKEKGIDTEEEIFYVKGKPSQADLKAAEEFAKKFL